MKMVMNLWILQSNSKRIDLLRSCASFSLILPYGNNLYAVVFYVHVNFYVSFLLVSYQQTHILLFTHKVASCCALCIKETHLFLLSTTILS
jgi:hypothetical protein